MTLRPARPFVGSRMTSLPPRPAMTSRCAVPWITSSCDVPTIVATRPWHRTITGGRRPSRAWRPRLLPVGLPGRTSTARTTAAASVTRPAAFPLIGTRGSGRSGRLGHAGVEPPVDFLDPALGVFELGDVTGVLEDHQAPVGPTRHRRDGAPHAHQAVVAAMEQQHRTRDAVDDIVAELRPARQTKKGTRSLEERGDRVGHALPLVRGLDHQL